MHYIRADQHDISRLHGEAAVMNEVIPLAGKKIIQFIFTVKMSFCHRVKICPVELNLKSSPGSCTAKSDLIRYLPDVHTSTLLL
ncbi:hypothetical protein D3C75_1029410 [compost metagenome]